MEILDCPLPTGVCARIEGSGGREIMLRADIDALSQNEQYESPWKSRIPGKMHACGHDFHTASLCGAAFILARLKREGGLKNTVDLLFQPAEEGVHGAKALIKEGLFEIFHPDYCFGLHNWPDVPSGKIVCKKGALMAAERNFRITVKGAGGHGSQPHLNKDAIVAAAAVVTALQTIVSRNADPMDHLVVSMSRIEGGVEENITCEKVMIKGTIRSLSEDTLDMAVGRTEMIVKSVAEGYGCAGSVEWDVSTPVVYNAPELYDTAKEAVILAAGEDAFYDAPSTLISEDFAVYQSLIPGFFFWAGSTPEGEECTGLHRPDFHTDDNIMKTAAALMAACGCMSS